jgi:trehalose synthase
MHLVDTRPLPAGHVTAFLDLIGDRRAAAVRAAATRIRDRLAGGRLWHVNSTGAGGGVAEMLHVLVPLYRQLGVAAHWAVVDGDDAFFDVTKRLGALAYGSTAAADLLGPSEVDGYRSRLAAQAADLRALLGPADVVLLHDHQCAGMVAELAGHVAAVYWRGHVGVDVPTAGSAAAWAIMGPALERADGVMFSVRGHVPAELRDHAVTVNPPVIWPYAVKNAALPDPVPPELLDRCGLGPGAAPGYVVAEGPRDGQAPLVVQVSRWDRLKDMHNVLTAFAEWVPDAHLALVGPDPRGIPDDIEQAHWFGLCRHRWLGLPRRDRARVRLVCLPMADLDDNARLVNAAQRAADVVTQKSLAEGFGLTVTEAMWKGRAVVASAVGGISAQIEHGRSGLLVEDPADLERFGELVASVTAGVVDGPALGRAARATVLADYLPDTDLANTAAMLTGEGGIFSRNSTGDG